MAISFWNDQATVNTVTNGLQERPTVTQLVDGSIVVAWTDASTGQSDVKFQRFDALGNKLGVETIVHAASNTDQAYCGVTGLTNGTYVVTWVDVAAKQVYAQRFTAAGAKAGAAIAIAGAEPLFLDNYDLGPPVVKALPGGGYVIAYVAESPLADYEGNIVGRIVSASGVLGAEFGITQTWMYPDNLPALAVGNGRIYALWNKYGTLHSNNWDLAGANPAIGYDPNITGGTGGTSAASITALDNGTLVVVRSAPSGPANSASNIIGQILLPDGTALGDGFVVNATLAGYQSVAKVAALQEGRFIVVYETAGVSTDTIRAQVCNADGTRLGGEVTIATTGRANPTVPDIVTLADGRVAVVWDDAAADGSNIGIAMRILDPRDGAFSGGSGADTLYGNDGANDIFGGNGGNDVIFGYRGADSLSGGVGDDTLHGGKGDDLLSGGGGNDLLLGGRGDDDLLGGDGNDTLEGGAGADLLSGGAGIDTASYESSTTGVVVALDRTLAGTGDAADDSFTSVEGLRGANTIVSGDTLRGDAGGNVLAGLAGNDNINGRGGLDKITGGAGADTLSGSSGGDWFFYYAASEGGDTITDFASGSDTLRFKGAAFAGLTAATYSTANFVARADNVAQDGNDVFIFRTTDKSLWFDATGNVNGATDAVMIANLQDTASLVFSDIVIF